MTINNKVLGSLIAVAVSALVAGAQAQTQPGGNSTNSGAAQQTPATLSADDRLFVTDAEQSSLAEVEFSKLALQNSQSDPVKAFAQQMIDDHTKANNELSALVTMSDAPPLALNPKNARYQQQLESVKGPGFDKVYIRSQIRDHKAAVRLYRTEANHGGNIKLKEYAIAMLPRLRDHLNHARTVKATVQGGEATAG